MFESLDFIYLPTRDVDAAAAHHLGELGAEPLWTVRAMDTTVAALRVSRTGPQILLSDRLEGDRPVLVYRVADYQQTLHSLRDRGLTARAPRSASTAASAMRCTSSPAPTPTTTSPAASTGSHLAAEPPVTTEGDPR